MRNERMAATEDLREERRVVLEAVHKEVVATTQDLNAASERAVQDFEMKGRTLIDHFFLRALELVLLTLLLCSSVAWVLLRRFAVRPPDSGEKLYDRAA